MCFSKESLHDFKILKTRLCGKVTGKVTYCCTTQVYPKKGIMTPCFPFAPGCVIRCHQPIAAANYCPLIHTLAQHCWLSDCKRGERTKPPPFPTHLLQGERRRCTAPAPPCMPRSGFGSPPEVQQGAYSHPLVPLHMHADRGAVLP